MATPNQIAANKANAQKSTGPKTPEGKAKSSTNRLSWGFASNTIVIPGEDPEEFRALVVDFIGEHQPATVTEQVLVEKMAQNQWLSLRAFRLQGENFLTQKLRCEESGIPKTLGLLIRYHTSAERAFHRAHNELVKKKKQRQNSEIGFEPQNFGEEVPPPSEPASEAPPKQPKTASTVPISPKFSIQPDRPAFTADELDFELCPEALEYFKKVG
jgi:hypothetical protein